MDARAIASFANVRALVQPIVDLDTCLIDRYPEFFARLEPDEIPSSQIFVRMFSLQRVAARLSFSGQGFEARALLRAALECGVYGWALLSDSKLQNARASRDEQAYLSNDPWRKLGWAGIIRDLGKVAGSLGARVNAAHESLISFEPLAISSDAIDATRLNREVSVNATANSSQVDDANNLRVGLLEYMHTARLCFELLELTFKRRLVAAKVVTSVRASFEAFESASESATFA